MLSIEDLERIERETADDGIYDSDLRLYDNVWILLAEVRRLNDYIDDLHANANERD